MGIGKSLAEANQALSAFAGSKSATAAEVMVQQNAVLIEQNNTIIALLDQQNTALQYLAKAKSHELTGQ